MRNDRYKSGAVVSKQDFEVMRRAMVASQLRTTAVSDPRIVAAMEAVAREDFVPVDRRALAYVDVAVPLGGGRALNAPMATGRLLNEAQLSAQDHVLLIGAASGYTAALLSRLVKSVVALDCDPGLSAQSPAAPESVAVVTSDLALGWPEGAPYDRIIIDGSVDQVPDAITNQLTEGGRIATGLNEDGVTRLAVGVKAGSGIGLRAFADVDAVALPGFARAKSFSF
jgi:protein-L-isoaspartate(D-aspartate) O-methyltransferase